ncbi:MAG: IclR family transcriptional regulator, partial [Acetobacteraceae bacterium]
MAFSNRKQGLGSLNHALDALEALARAGSPVLLARLAEEIGMSRPGVYRILATLAARGYVDRREGGRYLLGTAARRLGQAVPVPGITEVAAPFMQALTGRTEESVILGRLEGCTTTYLYRTETTRAVIVHTEVGSRLPAHCTSTGLVILAALPEDELASHLPETLETRTESSITSHDALRREMATIRRRGYAMNMGGWRSEVAGVAAAITGEDGRAEAAICIAVPRYRATRSRLAALAREL